MSEEFFISADMVNESTRKTIGMPVGLNRHERRRMARQQKKQQDPIIVSGVDMLAPVGDVIQEDDSSVCLQTLNEYGIAQFLTRNSLEWYRIYRAVEIPDSSLRVHYKNSTELNPEDGELNTLWLQANPRKVQQRKREITSLTARGVSFIRRNGNRITVDEEEVVLARVLIEDMSIPIEDIFKEILRSRSESIELLKMQIEWQAAQREIQEPIIESDEEEQSVQVIDCDMNPDNIIKRGQLPKNDFSLLGWDLFWTRSHWSSDPDHLVPLPTTARADTLKSLTDVTRGEISVKPSSILRALEFHLQKDIIQRALSTRNKYGSEGTKDWVKIKRGRDRIFFLIPQADQHRAVFFAGGRDVVYRNI